MAEAQSKAKQAAFLAAFAELGNVTGAAEAAGVHRQRHWEWLKDPGYADRFADAQEQAVERLETEARRRAIVGVEEPVYQGGKLVGGVRKYSDTLLIFLLKGARPERYRERFDVRQQVVTVDAIDAEIARLEAEVAANPAGGAAGPSGATAGGASPGGAGA